MKTGILIVTDSLDIGGIETYIHGVCKKIALRFGFASWNRQQFSIEALSELLKRNGHIGDARDDHSFTGAVLEVLCGKRPVVSDPRGRGVLASRSAICSSLSLLASSYHQYIRNSVNQINMRPNHKDDNYAPMPSLINITQQHDRLGFCE